MRLKKAEERISIHRMQFLPSVFFFFSSPFYFVCYVLVHAVVTESGNTTTYDVYQLLSDAPSHAPQRPRTANCDDTFHHSFPWPRGLGISFFSTSPSIQGVGRVSPAMHTLRRCGCRCRPFTLGGARTAPCFPLRVFHHFMNISFGNESVRAARD